MTYSKEVISYVDDNTTIILPAMSKSNKFELPPQLSEGQAKFTQSFKDTMAATSYASLPAGIIMNVFL